MEETQTQSIDTQKFMVQYSRLSENKLEAEVARAYSDAVRRDVREAQDRADQVVNALTSRTKPPDFATARSALKLLARGPAVVVAHWQPFIAAVAESLPAPEQGEIEASSATDVDTAAQSAAVKDLRAVLGSIGATLPVASARELRELREGFAMLGDAIGVEFGKRGMAFETDGSAAELGRLLRELSVAIDVDKPLPKDFAFSNRELMHLRAFVDQHRAEVEALAAQLAELRENATADAAVNGDMQAELNGLKAQLEAANREREGAQKTRDEMAKAADTEVAAREKAEQRVKDLEQQLADSMKRAGELEHEYTEFKKLHKKPKCG